MRTSLFIKAFCWITLLAMNQAIWSQTQMELLQHWAPEVYQDVNSDKQSGRQFYSARDIPVKFDFDGSVYTGDNWNNSHYQVWEQGQLSDRLTPALYATAYCSFVETVNFYFLGYGYYHAGDDSNLSSDRHENDWEMVMLCIKKDGTPWGSFQGMLTQFHTEHKQYDKNYNRWNGSHPQVYISANGVFNLFSPSSHGHGIEAFTNSGYQDDQGDDAIVLQVADNSDNVLDVFIPGTDNWNNALRFNYKLISINELWGFRNNSSVFKSYTTFQGGVGNIDDGGNPPWDKGYFCDPINKSGTVSSNLLSQFATSSTYDYLDSEIATDSYIFNPYYKNNSSQQLIDNPDRIIPSNSGWSEVTFGNGEGVSLFHRDTYTLSGLGSDYSGSSDNGYFIYQQMIGDCEIVASLDQVQNISTYTKAGVMIRESLNANAKNVFACVSPNKLFWSQKRALTAGETTASVNQLPDITAPSYIKLSRQGNTFNTYYSTDGVNFVLGASETIDMGNQVFVGLAVSSYSTTDYASAVFCDVTLTGTTNNLPVVDFTANQTIIQGESITFTDLSTNNPTSWSWAFEGGTPSGSTSQHPTINYNTPGTYDVTLTATNADGSSTETKTDYITVYDYGTGTNLAPDASISVSSEYIDPNWSKEKLTDGISGQDANGEWASNGEVTPWAQLSWNQYVTTSRIILYDRPSPVETIYSGTLIFSDGSSVPVGALPDNGDPLIVEFSERTITWVRFQVNHGDAYNNGLAEMEVFGEYTSGMFANLAPDAAISVSSEYIDPNWAKEKITDGISGQNGIGEWASSGESTPWAQLNWSQTLVTSRVVVYDRPNLTESIAAATLIFSDGSSEPVGALPNNGAPLEITFAEREISWVRLQVTDGQGPNNGLAEFEVFGYYAPIIPNLAPVATITVSSEYPNSNWSKEKLTDGIIGQDANGEWASNGEVTPWAQLNWNQSVVLSRISLYDRPSPVETIYSGTLFFSDGSSLAVGALPDHGAALDIFFDEKTVTWVRFEVNTGDAYNNGLSEMQAYGTYAGLKSSQDNSELQNGIFDGIRIYPNPITDWLTIECSEDERLDVELYDLAGNLIYTDTFEGTLRINKTDINRSGLLILKLTYGNSVVTKKIVIQ